MRPRSPWLTGLALVALLVLGVWQLREQPNSSTTPPTAVATASPASPATPLPAPAVASGHDLSVDERRGGHTLERHVGRSVDDLRDRLSREPNISAASTYTDRAMAERTVERTLTRERSRIDAWLRRTGPRPNLALDHRGPRDERIGISVPRGRRDPVPCTDAIVVLRWDRDGYFVLTSYPEARR